MRFTVTLRQGYLRAELINRQTADDMREFLHAVQAACQEHGCPRILMVVRRSRAIFKPQDYGFDGKSPGYVTGLVSSKCQIALLGDSSELQAAHEYIEVVARQQQINARAFRDEAAALAWLQSGLQGVPPPRSFESPKPL